MSIFGIKDLDHKLAELLDDADLKNLNFLNKSSLRIYDNVFYKRRFLQYLQNLENHSILPEMNITEWRKFYYAVKKCLNEESHVSTIYKLIEKDRDDLLSLMFRAYKYSSATIYDWSEGEKDYIFPMARVIYEDKEKCFNYLFQFGAFDVNDVFRNHAHKIMKCEKFQESLNRGIKIMSILDIFKNDCLTCFNSIYSEELKKDVINLLYNLYGTDVLHLSSVYSAAFSAFMKTWTEDELLYQRNRALNENRYDLVKLYTIYTSIFRNFHV